MLRALVAWIGHTDLRAPAEPDAVGLGPIAQALGAERYDHVLLLSDHAPALVAPYRHWLAARARATRIEVRRVRLTGPTRFGEIYVAALREVTALLDRLGASTELSFHLSPGTPAMAAVWIIVAKTRFPAARLIESSKAHGVAVASVPFDLAADFLPDLVKPADDTLQRLSVGLPPDAPEFDELVHRDEAMRRVILLARRLAPRSVPVLIEGESGTGKELLARAIHRASPRQGRPFVAVNCGAIPAGLIEAELFGHERGAFTGASGARRGVFEQAHGGTLFLDEIGDLPLDAQVKLLRVLQDGELRRVGGQRTVRIDVRILAATHRAIGAEVGAGRFREDLFYRLAVGVVRIPPLRDRRADLGLLLDRLLARVNQESATEPGYRARRLSAGARKRLLAHGWPGNVRELLNTLRRAAVWSAGPAVTAEEADQAIISVPWARDGRSEAAHEVERVEPGEREIGRGFDLRRALASVARGYLEAAMRQTGGNKTHAARLLGLPSHQTLGNWLARYGGGG